ncbi:MAG: 11K-like protein [Betabaculovirus sp.]|nr:MAG: 11K-like protein [Betabaculovirus sp.]
MTTRFKFSSFKLLFILLLFVVIIISYNNSKNSYNIEDDEDDDNYKDLSNEDLRSLCENKFGNIRHSYFFDRFIMCAGSQVLLLFCGEGFFFDENLKFCALSE